MRWALRVALCSALLGCGDDEPTAREDAGLDVCPNHCFVMVPPATVDDAGAEEDGGTAASTDPIESIGCEPRRVEMPPTPVLPFPRNVILLMGDGMGPNHIAAAGIVAGRALAFAELEGPVGYDTSSLDAPTPTDSGAGATAMATGRCTYNYQVSVDASGAPMANVGELAHARGKAVGVVTNTYVIDASPMAFLVHAGSRYCADTIAYQLFTTALPEVLFGGFVPDTEFVGGMGLDERAEAAGYEVGFSLAALADAAPDARVLGLFGEGPSSPLWPEWSYGLTPERLRPAESEEPTLAALTLAALERLSRDEDGFFLFVENEHTDTIGHLAGADPAFVRDQLPYATLELERAVRAAISWVEAHSSFEETLLLVAADHETSGYTFDGADPTTATFPGGSSHTTLPVPLYAKGPGAERLEDVGHLTDIFRLVTGQLDGLSGAAGCPAVDP